MIIKSYSAWLDDIDPEVIWENMKEGETEQAAQLRMYEEYKESINDIIGDY